MLTENQEPQGTIIDLHDQRSPLPWWRRGKKSVTALELAAVDLEECRRNQLEHARKQEYHAAMTDMLRKREKRLQAEIQRLSAKQGEGE